jgi:hypothetical protein
MATLTEASIIARKSIRYFIYGIIAIVILRGMLLTAISIYKKVFPAPPPPPTVAFGKLSKVQFPEKTKHTINFSLETPEGGLPTFPLTANVYFMPKTTSNLLSLDYAIDKAGRLGFDTTPEQTTESLYKFGNKNVPSSLTTNIITGSFSLSYDLNADPTPISVKPPLPELARNSIKTYLSAATLYPKDLEDGTIESKYLKIQGGGFVSALSQSDANLVRIDLFRKKYSDLPVVTATPMEGNIWFMVSGIKDRGKEVLAGEYYYFPIDETKSSTYPIKTGDRAWQELIANNYYPASLGTTIEGDNIKIRKVYLAYYDSGVYTEFFQPVYVFEGDKDFVGYIPAVTSEYSE